MRKWRGKRGRDSWESGEVREEEILEKVESGEEREVDPRERERERESR